MQTKLTLPAKNNVVANRAKVVLTLPPYKSAEIECVAETAFSDKNEEKVPIYRAHGSEGKWSGKHIPPVIGSRVKINFNELGTGEVLSYFVEHGWLGIMVRLDKEPAWRKKQSAAGKPAMIFGAEITPI